MVKKNMKRHISLIALTVLLVLSGVFSSCGGEKQPEQPTQQNTDDSTVVTEPVIDATTQIPFVTGGKSDYTIVVSDNASPNVMKVVASMITRFRTLTGVTLESLSETYVKSEADPEKMILVGPTSFPQSSAALELLDGTCSDEYVITAMNGIIVIQSHFDNALAEAINVLFDEAMTFDPATGNISVKKTVNKGTVELPLEFDVNSIEVYTIVYPSEPIGLESIAMSLRDSIRTATGKTLSVVRDTASAENIYEILIGPTNRSFSQQCYAESSHIMQYEIRVQKGKLQLVAGGPYSAMKCADKFTMRILAMKEKLTEGVAYYATDIATDSQPLTDGADIRVMSSNVLAYQWGEQDYSNVYPVSTRAEIYAGVLLRFQPDIVGVQETDEPWMKALPYYLTAMAEKDGVVYTHLLRKVQNQSRSVVNFSSILYRSDLYTADASGCELFAANYQTTYCQRVGSWAKFTSKSDPNRQMVLINSHWAHETEESILSCVNEEAALVARMKEQYPGVPIFCTADYNSDATKKPRDEADNPNVKTRDQYFLQFVELISGTVASDAAREKGVLIKPGGCRASAQKMSEGTERAIDNNFIDHIVVTGGYADVLRHDTIITNKCNMLSDHSPIYADFSLTQAS